jgi:phosphoglycolate phosphatase
MNILFDLDGTLSNPATGIVNSILYALEKHQKPIRKREYYYKYIGPPLTEIFADLLGPDNPDIQVAIDLYREHYRSTGYRENHLYDGITELLQTLVNQGHKLHICTYKSSEGARKVMVNFKLDHLFTTINGCGIEKTKTQLISEMQAAGHCHAGEWMIGDRGTDIEAGQNNGLKTIAVGWGFGDKEELASSDVLANSPSDILTLLSQGF